MKKHTEILKQMLQNAENILNQERENNFDKLTCNNCTFENEYHYICLSCSRDFIKKILKLINNLSNTKDNWRDIKKHDPSKYFDSR